MKRSLRAMATGVVIGIVCAPRPAHAQALFDVGVLNKPLAAGCQTVPHTLGVAPKALILWGSGSGTGTGLTTGGNIWWSFGVTDGTTSRSVAAAQANVVTPTNTSRRATAKPITIIQWGEVLEAEADLGGGTCPTTWDGSNFYLNWTTMVDTTHAWYIHFLAIGETSGGTAVKAKVVEWAATASVAGTNCAAVPSPCVSVSTVGFQPSAVIHFMDYDTNIGAAGSCASPNCSADAAFMIGAMDATGHQWASAYYSKDNVTTANRTARAQRTDAAIEQTNSAATETMRGTWVSMDTNGFTIDFTTNTAGAHRIYSLALAGTNVFAGNFTRNTPTTTTPQSQAVPGTGFQPGVVLLATVSDLVQAAPVVQAQLHIAAADGSTQGLSGSNEIDRAIGGSTKTIATSWDYTSKVLTLQNNLNSALAQAAMSTLDSNGFTLSWTLLNDTTSQQITYLALGPLTATSVTLASFTATRLPDGKVRLDWRTGYEVDNVGFRLYREQNGKRVRINPSLVPGTAVIGGGRGSGGQNYTWSDAKVPTDEGPLQYWLEDVDLKGKATWHGPIAPAAAPPREPR